jgi:hypothetical protein
MSSELARTTRPIDWREPVPVALEMLRLAYPEIEVLRRAELDKLVAEYSNVPIDEGAAALGQELSALGWALYRLETGSDDSVFLLVPARQPPPLAMLSGLRYRNASDPDAAEESLDATLLVQAGRVWGAKAQSIRTPSVSLRLPDAALAQWDLGPGTSFSWLDERLALLTRTSAASDCTDEVLEHSHVVDVARWTEQREGIAHMLVAKIDQICLQALPFFDRGQRAPAMVHSAGNDVRLGKGGTTEFPLTLRLPEAFPPTELASVPLPRLANLPSLPATYRAECALRLDEHSLWLACSVELDARKLRAVVPNRAECHSLDAMLTTPASVWLGFDAAGACVRWQHNLLHEHAWGRAIAWASTRDAGDSSMASIYLVRQVVDNSGDQITYSQLTRLVSSDVSLDLQTIAVTPHTLNGSALWLAEVPGLPSGPSGYCVYGACTPHSGAQGGEFTLVAVGIDDGSIWSRSLRAMQPKFGECHYSQALHLMALPEAWVLLDIVGDNFGLQDAAWLWHLPTDRCFAIPLAAVSPDRENGTLHYHPDLACWFAHVSSVDADDYLEMLRPLPECIAALEGSRTLRRTPGAWIRESRSRTV